MRHDEKTQRGTTKGASFPSDTIQRLDETAKATKTTPKKKVEKVSKGNAVYGEKAAIKGIGGTTKDVPKTTTKVKTKAIETTKTPDRA